MCFQNIIKPFKYPHPTVFSLPYCLLTLLESPVPVLLGINKPASFLDDIIDLINKDDYLIFDLDNKEFPYLNKDTKYNNVPPMFREN